MDIDALPGCPRALREAMVAHEARVLRLTDHSPRFHVRLQAPVGPLFAWYSEHPDDAAVLRHELAVRRAVGATGVLRAPPVLASGNTWRLERMVEPDPLEGAEAVETVVRAWRRLTELDLPSRPATGAAASRPALLRRRIGLLLSPLPTADVVRARRLARTSPLPRVTGHGDFHVAHVLPTGDVVWVIDWELSGRAPLGLDLMQLWASLPRAEDRGLLLDAVLRAVEPSQRIDLLRLRYVALVRRIASKLAEIPRFGDQDPAEAASLLALLPGVRAAT